MTSDALVAGDYTISGLGRLNVLMGKNGSGKSTVLKRIHQYVRDTLDSSWEVSSYITPERSGVLLYDPNVENDITRNVGYLTDSRLVNQLNRFKEQSMAQYRQLEVSVSRRFQAAHKAKEQVPPYFSEYIDKINSLLDNVEIREEGTSFKIYDRDSGAEIRPADVSSGESELIALAIECLVFGLNLHGKRGVLLLDEPDVHLHPDLQGRLIQFIVALVDDLAFDVIIATHSTPVLAELALRADSHICLMKPRERVLAFEPTDSIYRELLPVFGAHPLSEVFNKTRTLLVEGDDDVRIWQQAVRKKNGALRLTPIGCGGTSNIPAYEKRMAQIVSAVYENGKAYSLRDADGVGEELNDEGPIIRIRMRCYSAENLLLSDDVLKSVHTNWGQARARITAWCDSETNQEHDKIEDMKRFVAEGFDRKNKKIKSIRNLLLAQALESELSWEILVGVAIAKLDEGSDAGPDSLRTYLGQKAVKELLSIGPVS